MILIPDYVTSTRIIMSPFAHGARGKLGPYRPSRGISLAQQAAHGTPEERETALQERHGRTGKVPGSAAFVEMK